MEFNQKDAKERGGEWGQKGAGFWKRSARPGKRSGRETPKRKSQTGRKGSKIKSEQMQVVPRGSHGDDKKKGKKKKKPFLRTKGKKKGRQRSTSHSTDAKRLTRPALKNNPKFQKAGLGQEVRQTERKKKEKEKTGLLTFQAFVIQPGQKKLQG